MTLNQTLLWVGLVLAGLACGGASTPPTELSDVEATEIALGHARGEVVRVEREREDGRSIVEVVIRESSGRLVGVEIDAATGQYIGTEAEEDDDDSEVDADSEVDEVDEDSETDELS